MKNRQILLSAILLLAISACGPRPDLKIAKQANKQGDFETAYSNFKELSDFGIAEAQAQLALMHAKGNGVEKNPKLALELMSSAANSGYTRAMFELGTFYHRGIGTNIDLKKASYWYEEAMKEDYTRAYHYLGDIYSVSDVEKAITLYEKAGKLGYARSWNSAAKLIYNNGKISDDTIALEYFEKAIIEGSIKNTKIVANSYRTGISVEQNDEKALTYYYLAKKTGAKNLDNLITTLEENLKKQQIEKAIKQANALYAKK